MPELPEIETIVRHLRPAILKKKIVGLESNTPRLFRDHRNSSEVKRAILGQRIEALSRLGKNIMFQLSNGKYLLLHLMMSGKLLVNPIGNRVHDRMVLRLSGNTRLVFNDARKFGRCRVVEGFAGLVGPDALSLSPVQFREAVKARRGVIKSMLLNQKVLAGIGNIYADEILWYARIHPLRRSDTLKKGEIDKLCGATQQVLELAVEREGSSMTYYRKPDGSQGGYYPVRKVYGRKGEPCPRDRAAISRIVVGQRSTHFCPSCQKL